MNNKAKVQPFTTKPKCVKCGSKDISRQFCDDRYDSGHGVFCYSHDIEEEHHNMHCRNCEFGWKERIFT